MELDIHIYIYFVFERSFNELLNSLQTESPHILIIEDINFDMSKENTLSNLCNTMISKTLYVAKHVTRGQNQPLLMSLCRRNQNVSNTINEPCFLSDFHNVICTVTKLLCPPVVPRRIYYRSYKHFNEEFYVRDLHSAPFTLCDIFDDPDDRGMVFYQGPVWRHGE